MSRAWRVAAPGAAVFNDERLNKPKFLFFYPSFLDFAGEGSVGPFTFSIPFGPTGGPCPRTGGRSQRMLAALRGPADNPCGATGAGWAARALPASLARVQRVGAAAWSRPKSVAPQVLPGNPWCHRTSARTHAKAA